MVGPHSGRLRGVVVLEEWSPIGVELYHQISFKYFLPYMGMTAILIISPRPMTTGEPRGPLATTVNMP